MPNVPNLQGQSCYFTETLFYTQYRNKTNIGYNIYTYDIISQKFKVPSKEFPLSMVKKTACIFCSYFHQFPTKRNFDKF